MNTIQILAIVLAVIVVLVLAYVYLRKTPAKFYRKAQKAHKKGEKFYLLGDIELAEAYYTLADDFRNKARERQ